jgi:Uma2 family endonuclease
MRVKEKKILTEEEYLTIERNAETKSEFYDGEMFGLAGTTANHNKIVNNIVMFLGPKLRKTSCELYTLDLRVNIHKTGLYTYPDVVVVCEEKKFMDEHRDTIINPSVVMEVLSPSTEQYDRTTKFSHYRKIESLKEYILIAQDKISVEHFIRTKNGEWTYKQYGNGSLSIKSIKALLEIKKIYDRISFDTQSTSLR